MYTQRALLDTLQLGCKYYSPSGGAFLYTQKVDMNTTIDSSDFGGRVTPANINHITKAYTQPGRCCWPIVGHRSMYYRANIVEPLAFKSVSCWRSSDCTDILTAKLAKLKKAYKTHTYMHHITITKFKITTDSKTKPCKHKSLVLDQTGYKTICIIYSTEQHSQSFNCLTPSVSQQLCRCASLPGEDLLLCPVHS